MHSGCICIYLYTIHCKQNIEKYCQMYLQYYVYNHLHIRIYINIYIICIYMHKLICIYVYMIYTYKYTLLIQWHGCFNDLFPRMQHIPPLSLIVAWYRQAVSGARGRQYVQGHEKNTSEILKWIDPLYRSSNASTLCLILRQDPEVCPDSQLNHY